MSGVNKKLLLVIAFATLVAVIPIPRAHASTFANSPSGSFLGTQTVTDTFTCPSSTQVATDIGPWHDSDTAQTGFGLTTEPPACPSNSGDTMSYYTQAVGSNGRIGGGVISQTFDCGQEDTDGCGSRFSTTYSYSNGQLTSERYTCATAQT